MKLPTVTARRPDTWQYARSLRTLRAYRNMGQVELAKRSGFSSGVISKWERGHSGITTPNRQILAEALRVPLEVFDALSVTGDPLVASLGDYSEMEVDRTLYNFQQAARKLSVCVNTFRCGVRDLGLEPRREFRAHWFTPDDLEKVAAWFRERAVQSRSRLRAYQHTKREEVAA